MSRNYMFNDRSSNSQRKLREQEQVELRRVRSEELLKKRRDAISGDGTVSFLKYKEQLYALELSEVYEAVYQFRIGLSIENNPPIQQVIDSGVVPRLVQFINPSFYNLMDTLENNIRVESAWVLTNIATGTSAQTSVVVDSGAIPFLLEMLKDSNTAVLDQSVWCLGNIAGDCENFRDMIGDYRTLQVIVAQIEKYYNDASSIKIVRNLIWLLANLNRGRNPAPKVENMKLSLKVFKKCILSEDPEITGDCFWGASYICDVDQGLVDDVLDSTIIKRCYDLLHALNTELTLGGFTQMAKICKHSLCPIIRMLGNIATGTDSQTQAILNMGFLDFFNNIFYKYISKKTPRIRKEICWILSNITAGTPEQVQFVIDHGFIPLLIDSISTYELYVRKEAIYALLNISNLVSKKCEYLEILLNYDVVLGLKKHLEASTNNYEIQLQILETCRFILEAGQKIKLKYGENPVIDQMISTKLVDMIEDLQDVKNNNVMRKAYGIIIDFFDGEDDE